MARGSYKTSKTSTFIIQNDDMQLKRDITLIAKSLGQCTGPFLRFQMVKIRDQYFNHFSDILKSLPIDKRHIYTKKEFAEMCGMTTGSLAVYESRGKVVYFGDLVISDMEPNKQFLEKRRNPKHELDRILSENSDPVLDERNTFQSFENALYLTRKQTCKLLNVDLSKLYQWDKRGVLKSHLIAGTAYYLRSDIDKAPLLSDELKKYGCNRHKRNRKNASKGGTLVKCDKRSQNQIFVDAVKELLANSPEASRLVFEEHLTPNKSSISLLSQQKNDSDQNTDPICT